MKASGFRVKASGKGKALSRGLMDLSTKDSSRITKHMDRGGLYIRRERFMMVTGLGIRLMGLELTINLTVAANMKVSGGTINSMGLGLSCGLTVPNIKGSTLTE